MTNSVNSNLKISYDIGRFILSQVPALDESLARTGPAAVHALSYEKGPDPEWAQIKRGIVLEVSWHDAKPTALYTRYGRWVLLGDSQRSFLPLFITLQKQLALTRFIPARKNLSFWTINKWENKFLSWPKFAYPHERISVDKVREIYCVFKQAMSQSNCSTPQKSLCAQSAHSCEIVEISPKSEILPEEPVAEKSPSCVSNESSTAQEGQSLLQQQIAQNSTSFPEPLIGTDLLCIRSKDLPVYEPGWCPLLYANPFFIHPENCSSGDEKNGLCS